MQKEEKSTITPTPEEVAAAQAILAQVQAAQDTTAPPVQTEESAVKPADQQAVIPAEIVAELTTLFTATMDNPDFFAKESRVVALRNALKVPMFDDRSMQQFSVSAREELTRLAMDTAIKKQIVPVMPTAEEITVLAKKKFDDKQAKDAAKAAKKNA